MDPFDHLSAHDVMALLRYVEQASPVLVGGQAISAWATIYEGVDEDLDALGPLTSQDIDFYHNSEAEELLAAALEDGAIERPSGDDFTPNAAVVVGKLGGRKIVIDFMATLAGVRSKDIQLRAIRFESDTDARPSITLLHPIDCVKSRLANINTLKRFDEHSIIQAIASIRIFDCYIDYELDVGGSDGHRRATRFLGELEYIIRDRHINKPSHIQFGERIALECLIADRLKDERFNQIWREKTLSGMAKRTRDRMAACLAI